MVLLKKENEIYRLQNKKLQFKKDDKFTLAMLKALSQRAINHLTIVKPNTILDWQRSFIKNFWSHEHKAPGRKPITRKIKNLILEMKQENYLWGCKKIANELKKINIDIHYTTVNRIICTFRKQGLIQPNGYWKRFLKMHWDSLFAMDFMTIDTLFGKRLYLLIILELKSRKIVSWNITENPSREFVKQRIQIFSEENPSHKTLIHDNAPQFTSIDYSWYDIDGVNTSLAAPNMNTFVERLNGTIRREALDHFLLISRKQVKNIVSKFIENYNFVVLVRLFYGIDQNNTRKMHQGINKIPDAEIVESSGAIKKIQILSGLHHHYYRSSA